MKLGICNELFEGWPAARVFEFASKVGYDGVEVAPFTLADQASDIPAGRRRNIARQARDAGIDVIGFHWLLAKPDGLHLSHPDDAIRLRTRDYLLELIDLYADLGGRVMVLGSPHQRSVPPGQTLQATWSRTVDTLSGCVDRAAGRDVTICIEQLTARETDFITTVADAEKMVDQLDSPQVRLILDVKAMSALDRPVAETIRRFGRKAAHVHANESDGNGPGTGDTDFAPIFRALREVDFGGYVSVEVFDFSPGPEQIARDSIAYLKAALARSKEN